MGWWWWWWWEDISGLLQHSTRPGNYSSWLVFSDLSFSAKCCVQKTIRHQLMNKSTVWHDVSVGCNTSYKFYSGNWGWDMLLWHLQK